jgi:hypothetical protein
MSKGEWLAIVATIVLLVWLFISGRQGRCKECRMRYSFGHLSWCSQRGTKWYDNEG